MPVTTRRYGTSSLGSSSYLSSSSLGNYRSNYSLSSTNASSSTTASSSSNRYNFGDSSTSSYRSYRSNYSTSGSSALGGSGTYATTSSYRNNNINNNNVSSNSYDENKNSLSTRIGVSNENTDCSNNYRSRYNRISIDKDLTTTSKSTTLSSLPPQSPYSSITSSTLPPPSPYLSKKRQSRDLSSADSGVAFSSKSDSTSNGYSSSYYPSRSSSLTKNSSIHLANDLENLYDKYSPSRYRTKYELDRTRSLSDAPPSSTKSDDVDNDTSINKSSTYTPRSEIRSVALRNALPTTSSISSRTYGDYQSPSLSSLYSSRNLNSDSTSKLSEKKSSYSSDYSAKNGGSSNYRSSLAANSISPSKSPLRDSTSDKKSQVEGLCGLWNIGNTCFMNSVLQCLSHTQDLTKFARADKAQSSSILNTNTSTSTTKDIKVWQEFVKLINQMWTTSTRSVNPSDLKSALSSKHRMYMGSAQQDAQEFLRYFLDALHGALNKGGRKTTLNIDDTMNDLEKANVMWEWYTNREDSFIKDLFVGQLKSSLYCTYCEKTSVMYDPFWDLNVPLPSNSVCKLTDCLDLYTAKDVMDGDEMPYCDYCKARRKCIKGFTIQRFPKYLVIHLKRFSEMRWTKMTNVVEFPTGEGELDLTTYASASMESSDPPPIYSLYAISHHTGSTHGGHYVGMAKHPITKKWHEFNDNFVSETRESSLVSSSAYLLFYERV